MKKFFGRIVSFLQRLFTNVDAWIHEHVQPSIELVQTIKGLVDSPVADAITALIPGDWDDKAKKWARSNLTKAVNILDVTEAITNEKNSDKKVLLLLEFLKGLSPEVRKGYYMRLSSLIAKSSGGGREKVKGHSVDLLTQMQYSKLVEGLEYNDLSESKYTAKTEHAQKIWDPNTMTYK